MAMFWVRDRAERTAALLTPQPAYLDQLFRVPLDPHIPSLDRYQQLAQWAADEDLL
jgi:hypothetical protein